MYPLFLNLEACSCLVVGAGAVGTRKILGLLAAEPRSILVIDPNPDAFFYTTPEAGDSRVTLCKRPFYPDDVRGMHLVFAATDKREINRIVSATCKESGILCNVGDSRHESSFLVPASIQQGQIHLALSTEGSSPALAKRIREELEVWIDGRYDTLAELLRRLRPLVLAMGYETGQNTHLFRSLVSSPLADLLRQRDKDACVALLRGLLPERLHPHIMELLHDLA